MRLFDLTLKIKISMEEATLLTSYLKETRGKTGEIGHMLSEVAQEMVDRLVPQAVMYADSEKKGSE